MLVGVIGKANVGKSTFFKAATLAEVEIGNRPFVTIKPNHAIGFVKTECVDKDFKVKCNPRTGFCIDNIRFVPIDMIDVAGLVPGAHEGRGLGLSFLDELRQADVFIHVIDLSGSTNEIGEPIKPLSYDPKKDILFLETELNMWYYQILKKGWDKFAKTVQKENQNIKSALAKQLSGLKVTELIVEDAIKKLKLSHKPVDWSDKDLKDLARELRIKTKPMIIAANKADVPGAEYNLDKLRTEFPDYIIIPCSAESELALREAAKKNLIKYIPGNNDFEIIGKITDQQKKALEFIKEKVLKKHNSTGVQEILDTAVFKLLKYIAIFPGGMHKLGDQYGNILPDCFLLPENSSALDFAFKIHTDLGKKFIKAMDVKKRMAVGKEHKLKHRDVIEIIT